MELRVAVWLVTLTASAAATGWVLLRWVRPRFPRFAGGLLAALPVWWLALALDGLTPPTRWLHAVVLPLLGWWGFLVGVGAPLWAVLLAPATALDERRGTGSGLARAALLGAGALFAVVVYIDFAALVSDVYGGSASPQGTGVPGVCLAPYSRWGEGPGGGQCRPPG